MSCIGQRSGIFLIILLALSLSATAAELSPAPQRFRQEVAALWPAPVGVEGGLALVDVTPDGLVRVTDGQRWYALRLDGEQGQSAWTADTGPRLPAPLSAVRQIHSGEAITWLATAKGVVRLSADGAAATELEGHDVRQVATGAEDLVLAATSRGLWRRNADRWERVSAIDEVGRIWTDGDVRGVAIDRQGRWWIATPAGVIRRDAGQWTFFTGREGLPYAGFTCVAIGAGSDVWFGTDRGAIRFDGKQWAYREGRRWLPGNEVRSIAVGTDGQVWLATDGGLGCIELRPMTLAEKAEHYEREIERYIKRTPLGYTSEVGLGAPGDRAKIIYSDSDNDGLWTAMYGAGECFAYAATKQPQFKARARQAFEALRFLQKVTQGGPHSPPKGYVARTIRPVEWPDPNVGRLEHDREAQKSDRLWKVYEPRWPKSADGKWYWKSDTSSDELDGHYFFYAAYHDLAAEDEVERQRVREVVRDLTDHLVAHDFALIDHDGRPTRWAVYGPRWLNHEPDWIVERGLKSLSILSYLSVAEHVTGDPKYGQAARELIEKHGYGANVMNPKVQMGVGSGNQSDDEMAFMCFYNLLKYSREEKWLQPWRFAFYGYWALEQPELNPFFNFAFAARGRGQSVANAFERIALDPWEGWFEDSMATLRGFPLDRASWAHHNSHRLDLVMLPPQQVPDLASADRPRRGHRVTGKVLPIEERHFNHWNTDPWRLDYGGDGRELASGTVFLLPYYMGLYHGFIEQPK